MKTSKLKYYDENTIYFQSQNKTYNAIYYLSGLGFFLIIITQFINYLPFDIELFGFNVTNSNPVLYNGVTIFLLCAVILAVIHNFIYQKLIYIDFKNKKMMYREQYIWSKQARKQVDLDFHTSNSIGLIAVTKYDRESGEELIYYTYLIFDEKKCIKLNHFTSYEKAIEFCAEIEEKFKIEVKDWVDIEYLSEYDFTKFYKMQSFT